MFKNPRYTNELGGIVAEYMDAPGSLYLDPGSPLHQQAVAGDFGPVAAYVPPPPPEPVVPTSEDVDMERDRRIAEGFTFAGVVYQSRPGDLENIAGASTAALGAMVGGAQPGNLRWHGGASDFSWIAADNSVNAMDAQTMFSFGLAAMAHKHAHIFAARAIKDMDPIPADFATNEAYWP
jgi:hypothetical protein